jgi:predicted ribonuclease toxin of YeeF-YezG toxin-antitoxin module
MAQSLNIRKVVTEEFKKEFRRIHGYEFIDQSLSLLKSQFDLRKVQLQVAEEIGLENGEIKRKYHRNNLRYLAKYFAQVLSNQLKSANSSLADIRNQPELLKIAVKTFKQNPQCAIYHRT